MKKFLGLAFLLGFLLVPSLASAHKVGLSTLEITVDDTSIDVLLTCNLFHLDEAAGLDTNHDRNVSEDELLTGRDALLAYFSDRMHVFATKTECTPTLEALTYDVPRTAGILTLRFSCGVPLGTIEIINHAFTEQSGSHQFLGVIAEDGRRFRVTFNRQQRRIVYEATPPLAVEVVAQTDENVEVQSFFSTAKAFVLLGIEHILLGYDHILFVLALLISARRLKSVFVLITCFTLAHSVTLALAALGTIALGTRVVEPLIAASILVVALENVFREGARIEGFRPKLLSAKARFAAGLVFAFGLIHGFGFASVLRDLGLPKDRLLTALVSFNVGVELGQLAIVVVVWTALAKLLMKREWYPRLAQGFSVVIGCVATYWLVERLAS
ncbi:MAG: hypothetical protein CO108_20490 [Deltaproteobacteria bacterium CG_4_9_14_3_um_filter_63_12]|nr:MAG: hypothetical protein CO108_20490 [Deltaproteobacteria bacterium CG_4_9_14_3_um_filter_63_12]